MHVYIFNGFNILSKSLNRVFSKSMISLIFFIVIYKQSLFLTFIWTKELFRLSYVGLIFIFSEARQDFIRLQPLQQIIKIP